MAASTQGTTTAMSRPRNPLFAWATIIVIACVVIFVAARMLVPWPPYVSWLVTINAVAFLVWATDKRQARHTGSRVPELALHAMTLAGGVVGAAAGMLALRHKTRHLDFWLMLGVCGVLHAWIGYRLIG